MIVVSNSGSYLREEEIFALLNENYKSEPGTSGEKGLGLGLRLTQSILKNIGGTLEIESNEAGTRVKVAIKVT